MGVMDLRKAEADLVAAVAHGDPSVCPNREWIRAEVLRHIVLGLPLTREAVGKRTREVACPTTGAGVAISGAVILGPLRLDAAIGAGGGPICPLEFRDCIFKGHVSAAHTHFSRLSFAQCIFADRGLRRKTQPPPPTLDFTGARLDGDLDLRAIRRAEDDRDLLWLCAPGMAVAGGVDLSDCRLRGPNPEPGGTERPRPALDLTLAQIGGDIMLRDATIRGGFKMRSAAVAGNVWLTDARIHWRSDEEDAANLDDALFMQGSRVDGYLMLDQGAKATRGFQCIGHLWLNAVEVGLGLRLWGERSLVRGNLLGSDLRVRLDFDLGAAVSGEIDLRDARIGGMLDISELKVGFNRRGSPVPTELSLKNATVGGWLRLARHVPRRGARGGSRSRPAPPAPPPSTGFTMAGTVDLEGLSCGTLADGGGRLWGTAVQISMNHFTYRQTEWDAVGAKPSHLRVGHWLLAKKAEGQWPWRLAPMWTLPKPVDFWEPWQLRRNWIYQHYVEPGPAPARGAPPVATCRFRIPAAEYRPQPFEQAIEVARREGRENFATQFEILKQRIEWVIFNRQVRWWLGFAGIGLGALWLIGNQPPLEDGRYDRWLFAGTLLALAASVSLMVAATTVHDSFRRLIPFAPNWLQVLLTWVGFFVPVAYLLALSDWKNRPLHFFLAFLIFVGVRLIAVASHGLMRFGFGYMRRPVQAIVTLILAFLIGWVSVHLANQRGMLVIAAEPVADIAGPDVHAAYPEGHGAEGVPVLIGNRRVPGPSGFARELSCAATISEPLYALDVLIPIVDLGEERGCEVRRVPEPTAGGHRAPAKDPGAMSFDELWQALPHLTLGNHRFWWWMKALYAIFGWIIVSLAILTFAQVNKTHAEPPMEPK